MKKKFISVWKDPVWSKVISAAILGLVVYIWSLVEGISFEEKIVQIYNIKISIIYVVILTFLILIVVSLYNFFTKPKTTLSRTAKLRKFNKFKYININILVRWRVGMGVGSVPYIDNVDLFCSLHNPPIKLMYGVCPVDNCTNNQLELSLKSVENDIESRVREEWDKINDL